jgi:hypothetical protein
MNKTKKEPVQFFVEKNLNPTFKLCQKPQDWDSPQNIAIREMLAQNTLEDMRKH